MVISVGVTMIEFGLSLYDIVVMFMSCGVVTRKS